MTAPLSAQPPRRPPFEAEVTVCLPGTAPGRPRPLVGRLKTAREIGGGREVWALRVPTPQACHPEGELVSLIVTSDASGWQAIGGDSLGGAIQLAEAIAAGTEIREPVTIQLLSLSAGLLALVQPETGP